MEFITPLSVSEISQMINNIIHMDKSTMVSLGYACYLYIMMDRFNVAPARRRNRRH